MQWPFLDIVDERNMVTRMPIQRIENCIEFNVVYQLVDGIDDLKRNIFLKKILC